MKKYALISVSDKTGVADFATELASLGFTILSSSGTAKYLAEAGVEVELVEDYTGSPEILGGRVKTLHPKIHAGILVKRSDQTQINDLQSIDASLIEIVVVNLYPFAEKLREHAADYNKMIEFIDIGGPTMLRAAAKNFPDTYSVIDPDDYQQLIKTLKKDDQQSKLIFRRKLAVKVFAAMAEYNLAIARYFSAEQTGEGEQAVFSPINGCVLSAKQALRYGENPQQSATYYQDFRSSHAEQTAEGQHCWQQLAGKELSYNNLLDFDAAAQLVKKIKTDDYLAVVIKHLNPCGVAINSESQLAALTKAKASDTRSHFGGIFAFNKTVSSESAANICEDFAEIVLAPNYSGEAIEILRGKKNLRIIKINYDNLAATEFRSCANGVLYQQIDTDLSEAANAEVVTKTTADDIVPDNRLSDLSLAWQCCAAAKSNAITIVKGGQLLASGAGQTSRIDAANLAISKASTFGHNLADSVAASDAFFPFPDSVEVLAAAGVKAIIVTKGSRMDQAVIETAERLGVTLYFAADRHFRH